MAIHELDVKGLNCPLPLLKAKQALVALGSGEKLHVLATDPGSVRDFTRYCQSSGNPLLESREEEGVFHYLIEKQSV